MTAIHRLAAAAMIAAAAAACTTKKTEPPAPSGPSEFGTSITLTAQPNTLPLDGRSSARIEIFARDANGNPAVVDLRTEIAVGGSITDYGSLSQKTIKTGSNGQAVLTYTVPASTDNVDRGTTVSILATPQTGDARGNVARSVDIRLVPSGTVGGETTVPDFVFTPAAPEQLETVTFDASDPTLDATLVAYEWDFGNGSRATGRVASHQFRNAGAYTVTLSVTDNAGRRGSRAKNVPVGASAAPTASFVFSPASPGVGEDVIFNGSASTAVAPRTIVSYVWQLGTGSTRSGMTTRHTYNTPGTYNVTLTVTDDAGNKGTTSQAVEVGTDSPGGLQALFTYSPTSPTAGTTVNFNASTSTSADPIVEYRWDFGNGSTAVRTTPTVAHTFGTSGTYVVTLRIKDRDGRTAIKTENVNVLP